MIDEILENLEDFSEASEVVHTVEVVLDENTYRIEVLKNYKSEKPYYSVRYYVWDKVTLHPVPIPEGQYRSESEETWVDDYIAWIHQDTPEGALSQALGFLSERKKS